MKIGTLPWSAGNEAGLGPGVSMGAGVISKRVFDVLVTGLGLLAISPFLLVAALAVWVSMGRPILFRDRRAGQGGQPFDLLKFRTMRGLRPGERIPDDDAARLTRVGRLLRSSSVDELPALINVLRGDMSLVGPRPLPVRYLDRYSARQMRRHDVLPGITGWAQVNGRNLLSWEDRFEHDVWYVENRSLILDFRVLSLTAKAVVGASGVSPEESYTMPEFRGSDGEDEGSG